MNTRRDPQKSWPLADEQEPLNNSWRKSASRPLLSLSAVLSLPINRLSVTAPPARAAESLSLPLDLADAIESLGASLSNSSTHAWRSALMATFAVLIHRYSGDEDTDLEIIARPGTGSDMPTNVSRLQSCAMPWPVRLAGDLTFSEIVQQVARVFCEGDVVPSRSTTSTSPRPLREDCCNNDPCSHFEIRESSASLLGVRQTPVLRDGSTPSEDVGPSNEIALRFDRRDQGVDCTIEYNAELFDAGTAGRILGHYMVLLRGIVASPDQRISTLSLLTETERRQLLEEWGRSTQSPPETAKRLFHEAFADQASRTPDAVVVEFCGHQLTYGELNARSNQLAHYLRRRGVGPNRLVGLCLERSPELVVGLLGILKAGGAFVPLEPSYPAGQLSELLCETQPAILITHSQLLARLRADGIATVCLDSERDAIAAESTADPAIRLTGENLAMVMFSSGSTGKPKAIPRLHAFQRPGALQRSPFQLNESDRHVLKTSLDSTLLVREVFWPLTTGGRMIIAGPQEGSDTSALLTLLIEHKITIVTLVPSLLRLLVADERLAACSALRHVTCFGEPLPADVEDRFCACLPAVISIAYGTTEAPALTFRQCRGTASRPLGNLGFRNASCEIYVLDAQLQPVPVGIPGELVAGGPGLAVGYLNSGDQTAERFIPHLFVRTPGARLYRTGDRARWRSDGSLEFMGRLDDQIKIRGYRVEPSQVESVLAQHPDVRDAAVVARPNHLEENQLVAFFVSTRDGLTAKELRSHLAEHLPAQMIPSVYIGLKQLPRRPNGKLDRKSLPSHKLNRLPSGQLLVEARNVTEELLASIWCEVLGLDHVSPLDNFFDLGGHSLLAARLLSRITAAFHQILPLRAFFLAPTVRGIAELLRQGADSASWPTLIPIQANGSRPPLFCVAAPNVNALGFVFLARHLGSDQPVYGLQRHNPDNPERFYTQAEYEALAASSIDELNAIWPEGPCLLCGFCEGAHIAFEMARQLSAAGREVALLAMFDTWPVENTVSRFRLRLRGALHAWKKCWRHGRLTNLPNFLRRQIFRLTGYVPGREGSTNGMSPDSIQGLPAELSELAAWKRWEQRMWPGKEFVPPVFDGRITVFRVRRQAFWRVHDEGLGWGSRAAQGVEVYEIPGEHPTFLREPHVRVLAAKLSERLLNISH